MLRKIFQRHSSVAAAIFALLSVASCEVLDDDISKHSGSGDTTTISLDEVAKILSELPLHKEHLEEVHSAVLSSSLNGYDEEYTMRDLFAEPGRGVGDERLQTRSVTKSYVNPLRDLIASHVRSSASSSGGAVTKSSSAGVIDTNSSLGSTSETGPGTQFDADAFLQALTSSDIQIYWPFSESWSGEQMPVITFDPEDGADANIGYRLVVNDDGSREVEEVVVDEELARQVPVWVVNRNSDAEYTSLELLRREDPNWGGGGGTIIVKPKTGIGTRNMAEFRTMTQAGGVFPTKTADGTEKVKSLVLKDFTMKRHYDSWFAGASEFFVKIGAVDDFTASTEAELRMYNPLVTDFMIVVKRNQIGKPQSVNSLLISDWNDQMSHCAFMITEDDGGTRTEWKCTALVRIKSMSYGVELNLPFNTRDDVVWRGQLSERWLSASSGQPGSFGDLDLAFELVEY